MLRCYVSFASCYRPPGSSAGDEGFSETFLGEERARFGRGKVCLCVKGIWVAKLGDMEYTRNLG